MDVFGWLKSVFARGRITSRAEAVAFLETRAAFVAQKSLAEYAQARANMMFSSLQREAGFQAAYEEARWRAYPATLSMVAEVMMGAMRARLELAPERAGTEVAGWCADVVARMGGHGPLTAADWEQALEAVTRDLARAGLAAPHGPHAIASARAGEVFAALPFHPAMKKHDIEMFTNTLAFHVAEIAAELEGMAVSDGVFKGAA